MRLWHVDLIPYISNQRLQGQHRECCALRGRGWGKPHSVINYIFKYDKGYLYSYHMVVINEMVNRGMHPASIWISPSYCGKVLGHVGDIKYPYYDHVRYDEHNEFMFLVDVNILLDREDHLLKHAHFDSNHREFKFNEMLEWR